MHLIENGMYNTRRGTNIIRIWHVVHASRRMYLFENGMYYMLAARRT